MSFSRSANPVWLFVDLQGGQLNDEYYFFTLSNTFPYVPVVIYQDPEGTIPWSDPIEFLPNGTLPDNMYFNDALTYRLEVRHGNTQADQLIYLIENYEPNGQGGGTPSVINLTDENQITNPQFQTINFVSPLTITSAGTYDVAPGWSLALTGAGTTVLTQIISTANQNTATDPVPPYALEINNSGWTTAILYQRFNNLAAIYSNTNISMMITALSNDGLPRAVSLVYAPKAPGVAVSIATENLNTANYTVIQGAVPIPTDSGNTNANNTAYVDMQIILPPTGILNISNVQVVGQDVPLPVTYNEDTIERQHDHLFHYYENSILIRPKNTMITGWNFSLNPYQFNDTAITTIGAQIQYIADQTILYQEGTSLLRTGHSQISYNNELQVLPVTSATPTRFAMIQYVAPQTVMPYWGFKVSSFVRAQLFTSHATSMRIKMRLIYKAGLPNSLSSTDPIVSWPSNSDPVFAAGWTAIAPLNDPVYTMDNFSGSIEDFTTFVFNSFQLPPCADINQTLGVVIYTMDNLNTTAPVDTILFDTISLVPNEFAIDTQPQTFDQVLRECQFYFEKSYNNADIPGKVTAISQLYRQQGVIYASTVYNSYATPFDFEYNTVKRATPIVALWSPSNLNANAYVDVNVYANGAPSSNITVALATYWNQSIVGTKGVQFLPTSTNTIVSSAAVPSTAPASAGVYFHYSANSLLGL